MSRRPLPIEGSAHGDDLYRSTLCMQRLSGCICVCVYDLKSTQTSCDINSWPLAVQAQAITHTGNIILLFVGTCINYLATKAFMGILPATGSGWIIIKINGRQLLTKLMTLIGVHSTMHLMHPN